MLEFKTVVWNCSAVTFITNRCIKTQQCNKCPYQVTPDYKQIKGSNELGFGVSEFHNESVDTTEVLKQRLITGKLDW